MRTKYPLGNIRILVTSILGSTRFTLTQSYSSPLEGYLVGAIRISEVWESKRASIVIASRISVERVGLILEPEGIG